MFDLNMTSDGSTIVGVSGGQLYRSTDSGDTFSVEDYAVDWNGVAMSKSGQKLITSTAKGYLYTPMPVSTTTGLAGSIVGKQSDSLELQYVGGGRFSVLSHEGTLAVN